MKRYKLILLHNSLLFILELIGVLTMMLGWDNGPDSVLSASKFEALRYFTVDSNIIMGIVAGVAVVDSSLVIAGKKDDISNITYVLSLVGTVGVVLTILVTVFFLEPTIGPKVGYLALFSKSNFFLHLVNPIFSIITFVYIMRTTTIKRIHTITGIIPMFIYSIYYIIAALSHIENGVVAKGYDWYGFLAGGVWLSVIVIPIFFALTYGISYGLWWSNKYKANKKKIKE